MTQLKSFKFLIITLISITLPLTIYTQQPIPSLPFPAGGFPMEQIAAPNEQELEEALRFIQFLEENDPEQLKQLEKLGQQMINQMSDEEINMLSETFNIAPDELREEAAKSLESETVQDQPMFVEPTAPQTPATKIVPKSQVKQSKTIVEGLIYSLGSLRQKSASNRNVHQLIRSWREELQDLMYYLKVIDTKQHQERLATKEFSQLLKTLSNLYGTLKIQESRVIVPEELAHDESPYELLRINKNATTKQIEEAYNKLADQHDPQKVEQRLSLEGIKGKDLKYAIKAAKLSYEAIEDAYEQISDPKMKKQIDRELQAQQQQHALDISQSKEALKKITEALSKALYTEQLLTELEKFLQKFEPAAAQLRKELATAEKKQIEEQKKRALQKPGITPGGVFEPRIQYPTGSSYGYYEDFPYNDFHDNYDYSNYPDDSFFEELFSELYNPQQTTKNTEPTEQSNTKSITNNDIPSSKTTGEKPQDTKEDEDEIDSRPVGEIIDSIDEEVTEFKSKYPQHQSFLTDVFPNYMQKQDLQSKDDATKVATYPPNYDYNKKLKSFIDETHIAKMEEEISQLYNKMRLEKDKRSKDDIEKWDELEEKMSSIEPFFNAIKTSLAQAQTGSSKTHKIRMKAHEELIEEIIENLTSIEKNYSKLRNKFE